MRCNQCAGARREVPTLSLPKEPVLVAVFVPSWPVHSPHCALKARATIAWAVGPGTIAQTKRGLKARAKVPPESLLSPPLPALATALARQRDLANSYRFVQRLSHIVDRQCCNRRRNHRLHLHARRRSCRRRCANLHPARNHRRLYIHKAQRQRMAHRN